MGIQGYRMSWMQFSAQKFHKDKYRIAKGVGNFYDERFYPYHIKIVPGVHNPSRQVSLSTKLCTVAPDTCGSPVWNSLHVTHLAPIILMWLLDFSRVFALQKVQYILSGDHASRL